jgi:hypothetical protein
MGHSSKTGKCLSVPNIDEVVGGRNLPCANHMTLSFVCTCKSSFQKLENDATMMILLQQYAQNMDPIHFYILYIVL